MKTCNKCGSRKAAGGVPHGDAARQSANTGALRNVSKAEWAQRRAALRGEVPMAQVLNAWRGPVTFNLGLRP